MKTFTEPKSSIEMDSEHLPTKTVLLNNALWLEEIHLRTDLKLLEGMRKTNLLERLGAFLLAWSYTTRLDQIEALKKKGIQ